MESGGSLAQTLHSLLRDLKAMSAMAEPALAVCDPPHPILVVEDEPSLQVIISHFLKRAGYTVVAAHNGKEALRVLRAGVEPCLILLDLMMPIMDGVEFMSLRREDPRLSQLPVVLCSAAPNLEAKAAQLGAVAHIQKPFSFKSLLDVVDAHRLASQPADAAPLRRRPALSVTGSGRRSPYPR
jgi:CheY-like chemotaxis protein